MILSGQHPRVTYLLELQREITRVPHGVQGMRALPVRQLKLVLRHSDSVR